MRNILEKIKMKKLMLALFFVIFFDLLLFNFFNRRFNDNILHLAQINVEELTKRHINATVKKYLNLETGDYIKLNLVNNNIISVDIDNNMSNRLLSNIINDLETVIIGDIKIIENIELTEGVNSVIVYVPFGIFTNSVLLSNLGPKIPVKANFLENIDAYVDVEVSNYGINNSLIKLFININIKVNIEIPIDRKTIELTYKYLLASKLISGKVPNILGSSYGTVNNSVN